MNSTKRGGSHMTLIQKEMMIDFLENHQKLNSGKFDNSFSFKDATALWHQITEKLNCVPGACKEWKGWRKAWYDLKAGVKSKNTEIRKHQVGTGGGHRLKLEFTQLEQRVLSLIGPTSLTGDENVLETPINLEHFQALNENENDTAEENIGVLNLEVMETSEVAHSNSNSIPIEIEPTAPAQARIPQFTKRKRKAATLEYSRAATAAYEENSKRKLELKQKYYTQKINVLERIAKAKEDIAASMGNIAESAMTVTLILAGGKIITPQDG